MLLAWLLAAGEKISGAQTQLKCSFRIEELSYSFLEVQMSINREFETERWGCLEMETLKQTRESRTDYSSVF